MSPMSKIHSCLSESWNFFTAPAGLIDNAAGLISVYVKTSIGTKLGQRVLRFARPDGLNSFHMIHMI